MFRRTATQYLDRSRTVPAHLLCLAGACAMACTPRLAFATEDEALPKAEQILEKFVEATGGKAAYEKLHNRVTEGTFEIVGMGSKAKMTTYEAAPNKQYVAIESDVFGKMESGTDGNVAWEKTMMMGPRVKEGEERAAALRDAMFNRPVRWQKAYKSAECVGMEDVDGKPCYKVVMTPRDGQQETRYYDKASHLLVKLETKLKTHMGEVDLVARVSDYKKVDGILMPHKIVQDARGLQKMAIDTTAVKHNTTIEADRFNLPDDVKALLEKEKEAGESDE